MCDWAAKRKKVPDWHVTSHRWAAGAQCFVSHPNVVRMNEVTVSKKRRKNIRERKTWGRIHSTPDRHSHTHRATENGPRHASLRAAPHPGALLRRRRERQGGQAPRGSHRRGEDHAPGRTRILQLLWQVRQQERREEPLRHRSHRHLPRHLQRVQGILRQGHAVGRHLPQARLQG